MKWRLFKKTIMFFLFLFFTQLFFCKTICAKEKVTKIEKLRSEKVNVNLEVGGEKFVAILENNVSVNALVKKFPMSANMNDLNANEKYLYLDENLPTNSQEIPEISIGDIVLFGSNCLVLFYKSIPNSYRYTKIGRIKDVSKLVVALGKNSVEVKWSLASLKKNENNINQKNNASEHFSKNVRSIDASKKVKKLSKKE